MRVKTKIEYVRKTSYEDRVILRVTFIETGAKGIMYVRRDALPHKYGME